MTANLDFGKVLFIDDDYDRTEEGIKDIVSSLVKAGVTVQYWNGEGDNLPNHVVNSRVIIIDLDLGNLGSRSGGDEFYSAAALTLKKLPGPFIAIIMAREFEDSDTSNLREYCKTTFEEDPIRGIIANEGLKKQDASNPTTLESRISSSIENQKAMKLLLLWEKIADKAKEKAFDDILSELDKTISSLVELLCRNVGQESAARELVDTLMRLVTRRMVDHEKFDELTILVKELADLACVVVKSDSYPSSEDRLLYNKLMFFRPDDSEAIWTGDIYKNNTASEFEKYALVLTPACDISQRKATKALVTLGYVKEEQPTGDLPNNLIQLLNFIDGETKGTLYLDVSNVQSLEKKTIEGWTKVCRLASPFMDEVLSTYGKFVSRIGTLEINKPDQHLKKSLNRYRDELQKKKAEAKKTICTQNVPLEKY